MLVDTIVVNSVGIGVNFTNNLVYGIKEIRIVGVKGFGKDLTEQHAPKFIANNLALVGPYSIQGKVLKLPSSGSGNSNISMTDIKGVLRIKGPDTRKEWRNVPGRYMNAFLNENLKVLYKEAGQAIGQDFNQIYFGLIKDVFAHRPNAEAEE